MYNKREVSKPIFKVGDILPARVCQYCKNVDCLEVEDFQLNHKGVWAYYTLCQICGNPPNPHYFNRNFDPANPYAQIKW